MPNTLTRRLEFPTVVFAETYEIVRSIEQKIKGVHDDAEFELLVGPDDALHLRVYSSAPTIWEIIELVEDDLAALEDDEDLQLFVVPVRHEDRESRRSGDPRRNGA